MEVEGSNEPVLFGIDELETPRKSTFSSDDETGKGFRVTGVSESRGVSGETWGPPS